MVARPYLFVLAYAGGVLFSARRKCTPDILPARTRGQRKSAPKNLTPISARNLPARRCGGEPSPLSPAPPLPMAQGAHYSARPPPSSPSFFVPFCSFVAFCGSATRGGEPAPLSPAPPLPGEIEKKECPLYLAERINITALPFFFFRFRPFPPGGLLLHTHPIYGSPAFYGRPPSGGFPGARAPQTPSPASPGAHYSARPSPPPEKKEGCPR